MQKCRVNAHVHRALILPLLCDGYEFDDMVKVFSDCDVPRGDRTDTLANDGALIYRSPKADACKNRDLIARIMSIHIRSWIRFRITECLRLTKHIIKSSTFIRHFRKNEVSRAVDNAHYCLNTICSQRLAHGCNNGNTTGNTAFGIKIKFIVLCNLDQRMTVLGHQLLIGSDNLFLCRKCGFNPRLCRFNSTYELSNNVDIRVGNDIVYICRKQLSGYRYFTDL